MLLRGSFGERSCRRPVVRAVDEQEAVEVERAASNLRLLEEMTNEKVVVDLGPGADDRPNPNPIGTGEVIVQRRVRSEASTPRGFRPLYRAGSSRTIGVGPP